MNMRKYIEWVLYTLAAAAVMAATGETETAASQPFFTLGCIAAAVLFAKAGELINNKQDAREEDI